MDTRVIKTIYWLEDTTIMASEAEFAGYNWIKRGRAVIIKGYPNRQQAEEAMKVLAEFNSATSPT